jgi:hypothetical protein
MGCIFYCHEYVKMNTIFITFTKIRTFIYACYHVSKK